MDLKKIIKRILREEIDVPSRLRRRINLIDDEIKYRLSAIYRPDNICQYESGEELLEVIMYATIDSMYWTYFTDVDDNSELWEKMFRFMEKNIKDNYGEEIKQYYQTNCEN